MNSPTERHAEAHVVIDAYRRWGDECVARLEGEFAFILWDTERRRLLFACDRTGTRSLAYFFDGRTLLIASRALSLLRHPLVGWRWNRVYLAHVLGGTWAQPPGITAFEGISRVRPGRASILENGRLVERQATYISSGRQVRRAEDAYEEFWSLLKVATSSRFSGPEETCLSLSGGLDSSLVGAALACHSPEYHAFSLVSAQRPDLDERPAIEAFCIQHRRVQWHPMACDESATETDSFPLTDDPVVTADPLKYARRDLMKSMSDHGFTSVLGGEGGDELFSMSRRIGDFASPRHWLKLARAIANRKRKQAVIWRGLIVPKLPPWGKTLWAWRERRRLGISPWLSPRFWDQDAAREAREQAQAWASVTSTSIALRGILEHPANVGSNSALRLVAASFGLDLRTPMLDRALVHFVLNLPPELLWTSSESKPFLRAAGRGRLPREILQLKKQVGLHRMMRDRALAHQDTEAVARLLQSNDLLAGSVDAKIVADCLRTVARGLELPERQAEALYALIATARWMRSVVTEYGTMG